VSDNDDMPGDPEAVPARTVLIVDDSESGAAPLEIAVMEMPGVSIIAVSSAKEALRVLHSKGKPISVVITDLNMPSMDGFELIARIRADASHRRIPIIVVSGDTDPDTPQRVKRLGADAFFPKPYSPAEVCRKLEQLLNVSTL
jgi:two-component system chemotaxis response regulator CheY